MSKRMLATVAVMLLSTLAVGCRNAGRVEPQTPSPAQAGKPRVRLLPSAANLPYPKFRKLAAKIAKYVYGRSDYPLFCTQRSDRTVLVLITYDYETMLNYLQFTSETTKDAYYKAHRSEFPSTPPYPRYYPNPAAFFLVSSGKQAVKPDLIRESYDFTDRVSYLPPKVLSGTAFVCRGDFDLREIAADGRLLFAQYTNETWNRAGVVELAVDSRLRPGTYYLVLVHLGSWSPGGDNSVFVFPYVEIDVT